MTEEQLKAENKLNAAIMQLVSEKKLTLVKVTHRLLPSGARTITVRYKCVPSNGK